jgi:hypothetical protein
MSNGFSREVVGRSLSTLVSGEVHLNSLRSITKFILSRTSSGISKRGAS